MTEFYVVRYLPDVDLKQRKHGFTLGRFATFAEAEDHRLLQPVSGLLDTYRRTA